LREFNQNHPLLWGIGLPHRNKMKEIKTTNRFPFKKASLEDLGVVKI
jgi:hypothetical protein